MNIIISDVLHRQLQLVTNLNHIMKLKSKKFEYINRWIFL